MEELWPSVLQEQQLPGRAVCLLAPDSVGRLHVTPEAQECLNQPSFNRQPLMVVSIVGAAREGKSSLLNLLLEEWGIAKASDECFTVGQVTQSVTRGIWMWSQPIPVPGKDYKLVLCDVEGCNAQDMDADVTRAYHCIVYSISSIIIWNRARNIDSVLLEQMSVLKHATAVIDTHAGNDPLLRAASKGSSGSGSRAGSSRRGSKPLISPSDNDTEAWDQDTEDGCSSDDGDAVDEDARMAAMGLHGPKLLIALRDALEIDSWITPDQYLARALEVRHGSQRQKDGAQALARLFPSKKLLLFPEPGTKKGDARRLCQLAPQERGEDFNTALKGLSGEVQAVQPRRVGAQGAARGHMLAGLLQRMTQLIDARGRIALDEPMRSSELADLELKEELCASFNRKVEQCMASSTDVPLTELARTLEAELHRHLHIFTMNASDKAVVLKELKPALESAMHKRMKSALQQRERELNRLQDAEATRFGGMMADMKDEVERLIMDLFPAGRFMQLEALTRVFEERIRDRMLVRFDFEAQHSHAAVDWDKHRQTLRAWLFDRLQKLKEKQLADNSSVQSRVAQNAVLIRSRERLVLALNSDRKLKGMGVDRASLAPNSRHVFLSPSGAVYTHQPRDGEIVAVMSLKDEALWVAELLGSYWLPGARYRIHSIDWKLGQGGVPLAAQFRLRTRGNFFQLESMLSPGVVKREVCAAGAPHACYKLGSTQAHSHMELVTATQTALDVEIKKVMVDTAFKSVSGIVTEAPRLLLRAAMLPA